MDEKKTKTQGNKKVDTKKAEEPKVVEQQPKGFTPEQLMQMQQMMGMMMQTMMQSLSNNNVEEKVVEEVKPKKATKSNNKIKKTKAYLRKERGNEEVVVKSVSGTVCFKSPKTGITYNFLENGDEEFLTVDEILQMETSSKRYLHEPWLVVEDDEINEILGIKEISEKTNILNNIDEILELTVGEIEDLLKDATPDYKSTFGGIVLSKIKDETLRDGILIRELGRMLNMDFDLYK